MKPRKSPHRNPAGLRARTDCRRSAARGRPTTVVVEPRRTALSSAWPGHDPWARVLRARRPGTISPRLENRHEPVRCDVRRSLHRRPHFSLARCCAPIAPPPCERLHTAYLPDAQDRDPSSAPVRPGAGRAACQPRWARHHVRSRCLDRCVMLRPDPSGTSGPSAVCCFEERPARARHADAPAISEEWFGPALRLASAAQPWPAHPGLGGNHRRTVAGQEHAPRRSSATPQPGLCEWTLQSASDLTPSFSRAAQRFALERAARRPRAQRPSFVGHDHELAASSKFPRYGFPTQNRCPVGACITTHPSCLESMVAPRFCRRATSDSIESVSTSMCARESWLTRCTIT